MKNVVLIRHGSEWCSTATELEEGQLVISEDPQKRLGEDTYGLFEIRHEEHESIHTLGLTVGIDLARIFAKAYAFSK